MGIGPVSFTFTTLLKACGVREDLILGMQLHAQIVSIGGFSEDLYVGNTMIDMYVKCGFLELGRKVFDDMAERDVISWTSLIVAYARRGDLEVAGDLFDELPVKDMVAWTAMVTGFAQNARPREALEFFERMERAGVGTDEITLIGVISACAQLGAIKHADWIRDVAERSGFGHANNVLVGSALVDMYSKCGNIEEAFKVFEGMRIRNVFSYSSMIVGFAIHGRATTAIDLFEKMVKTEIKPNRVTFVGVLTACSHAGLVQKGRYFFEIMEKRYDVTPLAEHYACMVDLLGRAGQLEEALELIKSMPMEPNVFVWGALLGACRIHRNPDIAEIAASHLFELEPDEVGNYMLLSTVYASARMWEDVLGVRKLMRAKGLKKNTARSWVEVEKGVIHEFFAGEMNDHPSATKINQALDDLLYRLQLNGYEPNLDSVPYDVNDEVKKKILMRHSEKLALACGLVSSSDCGTIRIVKNIRICDDCHLFMCSASQITGKEIVIRDNMRFHHFSNGFCSCRNFW